MRGNVTLHACIGGGCGADAFVAPAGAAKPTDANDIVGAIHDLEILLPGGAGPPPGPTASAARATAASAPTDRTRTATRYARRSAAPPGR